MSIIGKDNFSALFEAAMDDIKQKWHQHEVRPFPEGMRGKKAAGVDLTLLESVLGGHIMAAVQMDGLLSSRAKNEFEEYGALLEKALKELPADAQGYFSELKEIVTLLSARLKNRD